VFDKSLYEMTTHVRSNILKVVNLILG